ncbi:MAG: Tat pathway signal protein [Gemmatimonadaceae bacterium]|nr:Tat pathway signal protein [Gemmatimonadaceae bacterium]
MARVTTIRGALSERRCGSAIVCRVGGASRRTALVIAVAGTVLHVTACTSVAHGTADQGATVADAALLDTVQRRTFDFFWETTNPANGLVPDRWPTPSFSSIAAVGFGLTAYGVGVERGWITRDQAVQRVLTTLRFFWTAPQGPAAAGTIGHKGFFYHFVDMQTGARFRDVELSTVDTSLLLGGVLFCQSYFTRDTPDERAIRAYADSLYRRVDWSFVQPNKPLVNHRWKPEDGYSRNDWRGYDESMILYVLALGSPTYPIDAAAWNAFHATDRWLTFEGQEHVNFAPLFGHQFSHVWIDFRGIRDDYMRARGIDWFENSRRAVVSQRAYAIRNPRGFRDYSANVWGLTAVDGPVNDSLTIDGKGIRFWTYSARGAAATEIRDDGTIGPTAAVSSMPFAPDLAIAAMRTMRQTYGDHLFQKYGFLDAFNPTLRDPATRVQAGKIVPGVGWFDDDYLGIDQGPIVLMIENYRSDLVWRVMRSNPHIVRGLRRAGFRGGWIDQAPPA